MYRIRTFILSILFISGAIISPLMASNHFELKVSPVNSGDFISNNFLTRISKSSYFLIAEDEQTGLDHFQNIYSSLTGFIGDFINDISTLVTSSLVDKSLYTKSNTIYQCTAPLPTKFLTSIVGPLTQLKHTWLLINGKTYGMPYTEEKTYLGGRAYITTPDQFILEGKINPGIANCTPIFKPIHLAEKKFNSRFTCIANKLSKNIGQIESWLPVLDYHVLKNNCSSAVRYITECADGEISQNPNLSVGSHIVSTDSAILRKRKNIFDTPSSKNLKKDFAYLTEVFIKKSKGQILTLPLDFKSKWHRVRVNFNAVYFNHKETLRAQLELTEFKSQLDIIDKELMKNPINFSLISKIMTEIEKNPNYGEEYQSDYGEICLKAIDECEQELRNFN